MARHTINVGDMIDWLDQQWIAYARDSEAQKSIECSAGVMEKYRVTQRGETVYLGTSIADAVNAYNEL